MRLKISLGDLLSMIILSMITPFSIESNALLSIICMNKLQIFETLIKLQFCKKNNFFFKLLMCVLYVFSKFSNDNQHLKFEQMSG